MKAIGCMKDGNEDQEVWRVKGAKNAHNPLTELNT